jgi:hypothetical protein
LAALAALAVVAFFIWSRAHELQPAEPADPPPPAAQQEVPLKALEPSGEIVELGMLRWQGSLAKGEIFRVRIFAAGGSENRRRLLAESTALTSTEWQPADFQLQHLPDQFRWEVHKLDATGTVRETSGALVAIKP